MCRLDMEAMHEYVEKAMSCRDVARHDIGPHGQTLHHENSHCHACVVQAFAIVCIIIDLSNN